MESAVAFAEEPVGGSLPICSYVGLCTQGENQGEEPQIMMESHWQQFRRDKERTCPELVGFGARARQVLLFGGRQMVRRNQDLCAVVGKVWNKQLLGLRVGTGPMSKRLRLTRSSG